MINLKIRNRKKQLQKHKQFKTENDFLKFPILSLTTDIDTNDFRTYFHLNRRNPHSKAVQVFIFINEQTGKA